MKITDSSQTMTQVNINIPENNALLALVVNRLPSIVLSVAAAIVSVAAVIWVSKL